MAVVDVTKLHVHNVCPECTFPRRIVAIHNLQGWWECEDTGSRIRHMAGVIEFPDEEVTPVNWAFSSHNKKPAEDQYPSKCPRCNRRAYIGLNEVEHADPALDATCR